MSPGAQPFKWKWVAYSYANQTHFPYNSWAPRLTPKPRQTATRKWPIARSKIIPTKQLTWKRQNALFEKIAVEIHRISTGQEYYHLGSWCFLQKWNWWENVWISWPWRYRPSFVCIAGAVATQDLSVSSFGIQGRKGRDARNYDVSVKMFCGNKIWILQFLSISDLKVTLALFFQSKNAAKVTRRSLLGTTIKNCFNCWGVE